MGAKRFRLRAGFAHGLPLDPFPVFEIGKYGFRVEKKRFSVKIIPLRTGTAVVRFFTDCIGRCFGNSGIASLLDTPGPTCAAIARSRLKWLALGVRLALLFKANQQSLARFDQSIHGQSRHLDRMAGIRMYLE
ncbi:MAG: hypothetical protein CMN76_19915 [Spirochaetaceae bacterium]|nr:hypothetical protein [Spirochaetaceae bacterium]